MLTGDFVLYYQVYSAMNEHPEAPTLGDVPKVTHNFACLCIPIWFDLLKILCVCESE